MARPLTCPKCGASIGLPDGSTVRVCACPQCGESIIVPKAPAAEDKRHIGPASLSTAAKKPTKTAPHGPREEAEGYPWHVKVVSALAAAFIVGLPLYVFWPRDTWERDNRGKILGLCSQADSLASQGKAPGAQQKYEEVVATIGDRQLADEQLRKAVARTARVQGEAKAAALLRSGDWAGAEHEYTRLLDFLNASPADDSDTNAARRRATGGAREARIRMLEAEAAQAAQGLDEQKPTPGRSLPETVLGEAAREQGLPKAIAQYDQLLDYLRKQPSDDPVVVESLSKATATKQNLETSMARLRAEQARRRQAEEERRLAEQRRQEEEAQRALAEARKRAVREQFFRSPAYAQMKSQADSLVQSLELNLALEDSAWRAISKSSDAGAGILAILIRMEAAMIGQDVSADVARVQTELDADMVGETSALRAVSKKDQAFLGLLGIWCKVLEKDHPGLCASFAKARQDLSLAMITEDSAYRAQSAHLRACMIVLQDIVAAQGFRSQADKIVSEARLANSAETSAIRSAMTNAEACMNLVLLLVEQRDKTRAAGLHRDVVLKTVGDDSAVRAHYAYKKTLARGLHILITSPGSP